MNDQYMFLEKSDLLVFGHNPDALLLECL